MGSGAKVQQNSNATTDVNATKTVDSTIAPFLQDILGKAQSLYGSGAGTNTWQGPTQSPFNPTLQSGFDQTIGTANSMAPTAGQPFNSALGQIANGGLTPQQQGGIGGLASIGGAFGNLVAPAIGQNKDALGTMSQIAGQNTTSSGTNLGGIAAGNEVDNPYIKQMLEANNARIANRVNSSISGAGRYGSGGHTDVLARSLAEADNPVLASAYESNRNRQLQANQQIDTSQRGLDASRLAAAGGMASTRQGDLGLGLNALAGSANATTAGLNAQQAGANTALGWAGLAPSLNNLAYDPANRTLGIGGAIQGQNQAETDAQRQLFEQKNAMPWTQLGRYLTSVGAIAPSFQNAGTTVGTTNQTGNTTQTSTPGLMDWLKFGTGLFTGGAGGGSSSASGMANAASALMALSDRNEKTDIKKIGTSEQTGLGVYAYRYKGDPKSYPKVVGPMAQEIEEKFPGSTARAGGKLYVKPEATGLLGAF